MEKKEDLLLCTGVCVRRTSSRAVEKVNAIRLDIVSQRHDIKFRKGEVLTAPHTSTLTAWHIVDGSACRCKPKGSPNVLLFVGSGFQLEEESNSIWQKPKSRRRLLSLPLETMRFPAHDDAYAYAVTSSSCNKNNNNKDNNNKIKGIICLNMKYKIEKKVYIYIYIYIYITPNTLPSTGSISSSYLKLMIILIFLLLLLFVCLSSRAVSNNTVVASGLILLLCLLAEQVEAAREHEQRSYVPCQRYPQDLTPRRSEPSRPPPVWLFLYRPATRGADHSTGTKQKEGPTNGEREHHIALSSRPYFSLPASVPLNVFIYCPVYSFTGKNRSLNDGLSYALPVGHVLVTMHEKN
eukprot:gene2044-1233_t